jgi:hypothetical protein
MGSDMRLLDRGATEPPPAPDIDEVSIVREEARERVHVVSVPGFLKGTDDCFDGFLVPAGGRRDEGLRSKPRQECDPQANRE